MPEILIYEPIGADIFGGITSRQIAEQLREIRGQDVLVRVNSPGGSAAEGVAIHNQFRAHRGSVTVQVDGEAASAASIAALGGDRLQMSTGSHFMIHNPSTAIIGDGRALRKAAEYLDQVTENAIDIYERKTRLEREQIAAWMDAETWFTADNAVKNGFADEVIDIPAIAAYADRTHFPFRNTPRELFIKASWDLPEDKRRADWIKTQADKTAQARHERSEACRHVNAGLDKRIAALSRF